TVNLTATFKLITSTPWLGDGRPRLPPRVRKQARGFTLHIRSIIRARRVALLASLVLPVGFPANAQDVIVLDRIDIEAESDDILVQDGYVAKEDRIGTKVDTPIAEIPQAISVV